MKKGLLLLIALVAFTVTAFGQNTPIIKTDKTLIKAEWIKAKPSGDLSYRAYGTKYTAILKKGKYIFAWVPKPKDIKSADRLLEAGKYDKALSEFKKAGKEYKYLGWDVYCAGKEAEALVGLKKTSDAIKVLEPLKSYKLKNPLKKDDLLSAYAVLSGLYINTNKLDSALKLLPEVSKSRDPKLAATAYNLRGNLLVKQGNKKEAVLMYLQAGLMFSKKNPAREEGLALAAKTLKDMNDSRYSKFVAMLKEDYPKSKYLKDLK